MDAVARRLRGSSAWASPPARIRHFAAAAVREAAPSPTMPILPASQARRGPRVVAGARPDTLHTLARDSAGQGWDNGGSSPAPPQIARALARARLSRPAFQPSDRRPS